VSALDAQAIRDAVRDKKISPDHGAELLQLHYDIERALFWRAWRERLRRWLRPWGRR
jgi:hypothetical protein